MEFEFEYPASSTPHPYIGKYYGIAPTDASAEAFGEVEVLVQDGEVALRMAGGCYMMYGLFGFAELSAMRPHDLYSTEDEKKQAERDGLQGFKHGEGLEFIFWKDPGFTAPSLMIRNWLGDFLGPTLLWRSDRAITSLIKGFVHWRNWRTKGGIPLISRGGLVAQGR